jgi:spore coat protein U-like protein
LEVVIRANVCEPGSAVCVGQVVDDGDYTVSTAESKTFSISASTTLDVNASYALSAEIPVSASYSTTMTNIVSVNINIQCGGGYSQVHRRRFFDEYEGTLKPDGRRVRI